MFKFFFTATLWVCLYSVGFGQNPISYHNVKWSEQVAEFTFENMENREVENSKAMTFFCREKVEMNFKVKIRPDGTVAYVSPPRCGRELSEFRKGGTSALYSHQFTPLKASEDQWVKVRMVVGN